jgi:hypothetical protein
MVSLVVLLVIFCSVCSIAQSASLVRSEAAEQVQADSGNGSEDPDVQIDVDRNMVVIAGTATKDGKTGSVTVIDYDKNVIAIYDAKTRSCYMTRGDPKSTLRNPAEIQDVPNAPASSESSTYRLVGSDASGSDSALLPAPLRDTCDGLPLKWMGPSAKSTDASNGAQAGETLGRPQRFWRSLLKGVVRAGVRHAATHYDRYY